MSLWGTGIAPRKFRKSKTRKTQGMAVMDASADCIRIYPRVWTLQFNFKL